MSTRDAHKLAVIGECQPIERVETRLDQVVKVSAPVRTVEPCAERKRSATQRWAPSLKPTALHQLPVDGAALRQVRAPPRRPMPLQRDRTATHRKPHTLSAHRTPPPLRRCPTPARTPRRPARALPPRPAPRFTAPRGGGSSSPSAMASGSSPASSTRARPNDREEIASRSIASTRPTPTASSSARRAARSATRDATSTGTPCASSCVRSAQ